MKKLYPTHIPTSGFQKVLLAAGSAAISILNPRRGVKSIIFSSEKPRITNASVNINRLRTLPDRTFGREYARFLDKLQTTPDQRPPVQFIDDLEMVYIMQRYRETHDLYHTILEMPTTILGEVVVKWFEGIQLGLPMCVLGGLFGAARLYPKQRVKFSEALLPWVVKTAKEAEFFMNIYWEKHWEVPIEILQEQLNILPAAKL